MKKSKSLRTLNAQIKYLNNRFKYHKNKDLIIDSIDLNNFQGLEDLSNFIRSKYPIIACGKSTSLFWTQNGYSKEESIDLKKNFKYKKDPKKSPMNIDYWIGKGFTKDESIYKIRSQRKLNLEYWISRGYTESEAIDKRSEYQSIQSRKISIKKIADPQKYKGISETQIEYWIRRGFSEEDAKSAVSKRQQTFTLQKCLERHGEEKGRKVWEERQNKWVESLSRSYDGVTGKSISINDKISKYDVDRLIDSITIKNKDLFKRLFRECETIECFVKKYMDYVNSNTPIDEISIYRILRQILTLKVLYVFYNTNRSEIMSLIIPKIVRIKTSYSNISWFNGHVCRSDSEYIIANFLFRNDIKYEYEKRYPNSKMKCDFFLTDYNIYIEYLGMRIDSYKTKMDFLNRNNIKYIASSNLDDIKRQIKNNVDPENK
jgi:hypothetical protein